MTCFLVIFQIFIASKFLNVHCKDSQLLLAFTVFNKILYLMHESLYQLL